MWQQHLFLQTVSKKNLRNLWNFGIQNPALFFTIFISPFFKNTLTSFFLFSGHCVSSPSAISSDYQLQNNDQLLTSMTRRTTTSSTYSSSRHGRSPGSYNLDNQYQNQTIGNGSSNNSRKKTNTIDVMEMDRLRNGDLLMENSRKR